MAKKLEIEPIVWKDSAFVDVRHKAMEEILNAIRVPPELLNTTVNTTEITLTYILRRLCGYF